ncbi:MAG: TadE family protein [Terracoccus sp.]
MRACLPRRSEADHGSAIAEFVMVAALLMFVALATFQLGLTLYVRNTLIASASEGARYGARADAGSGDASGRTVELISTALNPSYAADVSAAQRVTSGGVRVVEVTVRAPLPILGVIGPSGAMSVTGRAFSEQQVIGNGP